MSEASTGGAQFGRVGSGDPASGAATLLSLAAAPTFMLMAFWTALFHDPRDMFCMAASDTLPFSGMLLMYILMSIFHVAPWLKLFSSERIGACKTNPS